MLFAFTEFLTWVSMGMIASPMESLDPGERLSSFSKYCLYLACKTLINIGRATSYTRYDVSYWGQKYSEQNIRLATFCLTDWLSLPDTSCRCRSRAPWLPAPSKCPGCPALLSCSAPALPAPAWQSYSPPSWLPPAPPPPPSPHWLTSGPPRMTGAAVGAAWGPPRKPGGERRGRSGGSGSDGRSLLVSRPGGLSAPDQCPPSCGGRQHLQCQVQW